jgi:hypothetical protein
MRRCLAISIAMLLSLTLVAPLFAAPASANVPECCRRNGQHHCMGGMISDSSQRAFSMLAPPCPHCPQAITAPQAHSLVPNRCLQAGISLFVRPAALPQTEARYRISFARSRQKRGPPVILL